MTPPDEKRITLATLLNGLAASPWALSFTSFAVTAFLIQSNSISIF
jgi:hypothetical protein